MISSGSSSSVLSASSFYEKKQLFYELGSGQNTALEFFLKVFTNFFLLATGDTQNIL